MSNPDYTGAHAAEHVYKSAQAAEYGVWRAVTAIFHHGARAFNPGDPVPVSHVEAYGYDRDGLVEPAPAEQTEQTPAVAPTDVPTPTVSTVNED